MPIAQVIEISAVSEESFDDAIQQGIEEAGEMFENISGAWIKEQKVKIEDGEIVEYNVNMQVTAMMMEEESTSGKSSGSGRNQRGGNNEQRGNVDYMPKKQRRQE